jgi:predicted DNA-binding transcriptional regulator YafY
VRRADRLFEIVQLLQARRFMTAARLADELEVSVRTIYRDVRDLVGAGVPIEGEAGVGYALHRKFELPPLMFDNEETQAILLGARIVQSWADPALAAAAKRALIKVEAVLPEQMRAGISEGTLFAPKLPWNETAAQYLAPLRVAVQGRFKVRFAYTRQDGEFTERTVLPLGLFYWGSVWSLGAWCELRIAFRNFRLDRIEGLATLEDRFEDEPGRTLQDFFLEDRRPNRAPPTPPR